MNQDFLEDEVLIAVQNGVAVITLNRQKVLNALSLEMIRQIASALHRWRNDDSVKAVIFKSAEGRAFSAGGDIKSFYYAGMDYRRGDVGAHVPMVFFAEEYSLNKQIFHYEKPTIAIMNGITMGGGYGIAGNCQYRVASEETLFAMPEVGIGFFPDVGSMYHLQKCSQNWGRYLALTGARLSGAEMTALGLADFYVGGEDVQKIVDALVQSADQDGDFEKTLQDLHDPNAVAMPEHGDLVERAFENLDVPAISQALEGDGSDFAKDACAMMRTASPSSVRVTASYLERSKSFDFDEVIAMDFTVVQHFIQHNDLYEGVRTTLIDKKDKPFWLPKTIESLSEEDVNTYFTPTGYDLRDVQIFEK